MKITKARLKEIISEELEEMLAPPAGRMRGLGSSGLPPGGPSPEMEMEPLPPADSSALRDRLWNMVTSYIEVSGKDPSVPGHVLHAFERLAQEIAKG